MKRCCRRIQTSLIPQLLVWNDLFIAAVTTAVTNNIDIRPFHGEGAYKSEMTGTSGTQD
jgi:hypothetical protein